MSSKVVLIFFIVLTAATAQNLFSLLQNLFYKDNEISREDIRFFLYNKQYTNDPMEVTTETIGLNLTDPFKFIIHGYTDNANKLWILNMKNEYLKKGNYNVIAVDWSKPAAKLYPISADFTKTVGKFIADMIIYIKVTLNVENENVHLIGHSLGAHAAGFAGKSLVERGHIIDRITGLDPAGPWFFSNPKERRLCQDDAAFVDVIHTDGYSNGYYEPIGHIDFYPNGGYGYMPGCMDIEDFSSIIDYVACSHVMAYIYFIESINSNEFIAKQCEEYSKYINGECSNNSEAIMGENVDHAARGNFYLNTNANPPFAKNGSL